MRPLALVLSFGRALPALAVVGALVAWDTPARAEGSLEGKWRQGPLREDFTVQQWLAGCGPAPASGASGGGETVEVRAEGDELAFLGGGRVFRTNQCYDQLPNLTRDAHSRAASGRSWSTRCVTPATDPRKALLQTRVDAVSDNQIEMKETGRYEVILAEGRCLADISRSRSYTRIDAAPAATSAAPPPPAKTTAAPPDPPPRPDPPSQCTNPGEPARLEVRPSRKLLRTGESFTFRAQVVDAAGCATRTPVTWALAKPEEQAKLAIDTFGKVSAPDGAPEGEIELVASAAGKNARVIVEVTSPARYDELLARSGLNSKGENDNASVTMIGTASIGGGEGRAEDSARTRRIVFVSVIGASLLALGVVFVLVRRRARLARALESEVAERHAERVADFEARKRAKQEKFAAEMQAYEAAKAKASAAPPPNAGVVVCPACRREQPAGSTFCPHDGSRMIAPRAGEAAPGKICPACGRGYPAGTRVCGHDGEELVPYASGAAARPVTQQAKICPTCGGRFEGTASFCGKDGTALVLLN